MCPPTAHYTTSNGTLGFTSTHTTVSYLLRSGVHRAGHPWDRPHLRRGLCLKSRLASSHPLASHDATQDVHTCPRRCEVLSRRPCTAARMAEIPFSPWYGQQRSPMPRKKPDHPWRWVYREGGVRILEDDQWKRYAERLQQLLRLHQHSHIPAILTFAAGTSGIDPTAFIEWAADDRLFGTHQPERPDLAGALADVRRAFLIRQQERDGYSARDLLEEHVVFVPEVTVGYNWAPYQAEARAAVRKRGGSFEECRNVEVPPGDTPALPVGFPAFVMLRIPVSHLNQWDVGDIVDAIRQLLVEAIEECPTPAEAPGMRGAVPAERTFLVHCREEEFQRSGIGWRKPAGSGTCRLPILSGASPKGSRSTRARIRPRSTGGRSRTEFRDRCPAKPVSATH
jgi:hypothetical protein